MEIYPHRAKMFLREAKDALERLKKGKDADDIRRALISFLNATKHSIHQLQTDFRKKLLDFDEWYTPQREFLENNELCSFFWELRNRVTKEGKEVLKMKELKMNFSPGFSFSMKGPLQMGPNMGVSVKAPKGEKHEWQPKKDIPGLRLETSWEFLDYPAQDPVELCNRYLSLLEGIVDSFVNRFTTK